MTRARFVLLAAAGATAACGSDEPVGGGLDSGIPGDTVISELTPEQTDQFCEATFEFGLKLLPAEVALQASCTAVAVLNGGVGLTADACNADVDACVAAAGGSSSTVACELIVDTRQDCPATIADLEYCLAAITYTARDLVAELRCDLLASSPEEVGALLSRYDLPPPECDALAAVCPELVLGATI